MPPSRHRKTLSAKANPQPWTITGAPTALTAFVAMALKGPTNKPVAIASFAEFEDVFGNISPTHGLAYAVSDFFANGGRQALIVRIKTTATVPTAAEIIGSEAKGTGLYALGKVSAFNLLCIPPSVPGGETELNVYKAAMAYCDARRACLIIDPPATADPTVVEALLGSFESGPGMNVSAIYFPRVLQSDPVNSARSLESVPCGMIAGVMARTDASRGVWKSPSGKDAELLGVTGLGLSLTGTQVNALSAQHINPIRFVEDHYILWAARTLQADHGPGDPLTYISLRRLLLHVEESIRMGLQEVVVENNDERLWSRIKMSIENFLVALWKQGALQGVKSQEAFFVKCGRDTMTEADIVHGTIRIIMGLAVTRPAEFTSLQVQLTHKA